MSHWPSVAPHDIADCGLRIAESTRGPSNPQSEIRNPQSPTSMTARDPALDTIAEKVQRAERLTRDDALALFTSNDLLTIGRLADEANRRKHGDRVSFAANQHINPTNVCVLRNTCVFCSFARMPREDGAYTRSLDEVFSPAARATIADKKLSGDEWLAVHREAHRLRLPSNCTMLYGHVETMADRVDHLLALRALQDETGGFLTYIPLAYHPDHNELG